MGFGMPKRTVFWLVYLLAIALVLESVLQAYYWISAGQPLFTRARVALWRPEPLAGFGVKPNLRLKHGTGEFTSVVHTNSRGFRVSPNHEEFAYEKPEGVYRVLLLGPSFGFGWGVNYEDTMGARLETALREARKNGDRRVEVINAGVPSLPSVPQLRWLKGEGVRYQPDVIVQLVYGSMSVDTREDPGLSVDPDGNLIRRDATLLDRVKDQLKKSAVVFYGWLIATRAGSALAGRDTKSTVEGAGRAMETHERFDPADASLNAALDYYRDLQLTANQAGARLLIAYFPLSYCVHEQDVARWRLQGVRNVQDQIAFDAGFCDYLRSNGQDCLNLTDGLRREAGLGKRLYFLVDIHWTPEGNRLAAQLAARRILSGR